MSTVVHKTGSHDSERKAAALATIFGIVEAHRRLARLPVLLGWDDDSDVEHSWVSECVSNCDNGANGVV